MLDWYSRSRITEEQDQYVGRGPQSGQILPDYAFKKLDGRLLFLSDFQTSIAAILLPRGLGPNETYFLRSLRQKYAEVRREPTRLLVVTRPEHLSTVVALEGDMLIVSDEIGDVMLDLGATDSIFVYELGSQRNVIRSFEWRNLIPAPTEIDIRRAA
jgi:hypothetical protein